jgi:hypothetical protein
MLNERRFLSLDLNYGRRVNSSMYEYLRDNGNVNPLGLYDLGRNIRPVGRAYQKLIRQWKGLPLLPNGPLTWLGHWGDAWDPGKVRSGRTLCGQPESEATA